MFRLPSLFYRLSVYLSFQFHFLLLLCLLPNLQKKPKKVSVKMHPFPTITTCPICKEALCNFPAHHCDNTSRAHLAAVLWSPSSEVKGLTGVYQTTLQVQKKGLLLRENVTPAATHRDKLLFFRLLPICSLKSRSITSVPTLSNVSGTSGSWVCLVL